MASGEKTPRRLGHRPALDGLRALAVSAVICLHVGLLRGGFVGVDVFLPLSGFLITALLLQEHERAGRVLLGRFYGRRIRRLLPALLVVLALFTVFSVGVGALSPPWPTRRIIAVTLLCVGNWVATLVPEHGRVLGALSPTWTLAAEVQFYLLWAPGLVLLMRRRLAPRALLALLVVLICLLLGASLASVHLISTFNPYTSPFNRLAELLLGAVAAIIWRERLSPAWLEHPLLPWLVLAGLGAILVEAGSSSARWYLAGAVLSALLIVHLASRPAPGADPALARLSPGALARLPERILRTRFLTHTGRVSYGIYLYHVPLYYLLWVYTPIRSPLVFAPLVFAVSLAAASLSWTLLESRAIRGRRSAPRPAPVSRTGGPQTGRGPAVRRPLPDTP